MVRQCYQICYWPSQGLPSRHGDSARLDRNATVFRGGSWHSLDSLLEGSEEAGRRIVDEAADWAAEAGVEYDTELVWGRVPEVICRIAQERACDLIVVGSRGLTGFKRLMLGSISNAVAAKAPCPVLVVKLYEGWCFVAAARILEQIACKNTMFPSPSGEASSAQHWAEVAACTPVSLQQASSTYPTVFRASHGFSVVYG